MLYAQACVSQHISFCVLCREIRILCVPRFTALEAEVEGMKRKIEATCREVTALSEEKVLLESKCNQLRGDVQREAEALRSATSEMSLVQAQSSHLKLQVRVT